MGKLFRQLPSMILEAMKSGDVQKKEAYRELKDRISKFAKSEEGAKTYKGDGAAVSDADEDKIVKKMHTELLADVEIFEANDRNDLAVPAKAQADAIKQFVPAEATEKDIDKAIEDFIENEPNGGADLTMKDMGRIIKYVKAKLPTANGKMVHDLAQRALTSGRA